MADQEEATQKAIRISEKKTIEFLQLYKQETYLWDTNAVDYRVRYLRRKAAERIALKLNIPSFGARQVMMKFKNLRNAYCQELKKIEMSRQCNEADEYKPKVLWFDIMDSFIRPHIRHKIGPPTLVINGGVIKREPEPECLEDPDELWDLIGSEDAPTQPTEMPIPDDDSDSEDYFGLSNKRASSQQSLPGFSSKRARAEDLVAQSIDDISSQLNAIKNEPLDNTNNTKIDFNEKFASYIASLLRTLPMHKSLALQPKIVEIITKAIYENEEEND